MNKRVRVPHAVQGLAPPMPRIDSVDCWLPPDDEQLVKGAWVDATRFHSNGVSSESSRSARGWAIRKASPPRTSEDSTTCQLDPSSRATAQVVEDTGQDLSSRDDHGASRPPELDSRATRPRTAPVQQDAPAQASEALLEGFQDLLQQHREDLGSYIDERLQQHHETLFKQLDKHVQGTRVSMFPGLFPAPPPAGSEKDREGGGRKVGRLSSQSAATSGGTQESPENRALDLGKCSYEEHEKMRMQMSRRARSRSLKTFSNSSSREIASEMRACFVGTEWRRCIQAGIESPTFEGVVCLLIVSNVIFLGFEVESLWGINVQDVPIGFDIAEYFFTTCFTIEFALKLVAYGVWGTFCNKPSGQVVVRPSVQHFLLREPKLWNLLDFVLVSSSWIEIAMEFSQRASPKLQYVRIIRLLRTTRIIRLVKIMKFFRPLRILVYSLANTLRSLMWVLFLLALIIYLFAVLFTVAASNYASSRGTFDSEGLLVEFFGSLYSSTSSLFGAITGGLDWHVCVEALRPLHPIWTGLLITYIAVANFGILNVVTGVVCQTAMESAHQDHDIVVQAQLHLKQRYSEQLKSLFGVLANGEEEKITLHDFEERLRDKELKDYFVAMDLTVDEAWNLFKLLDNGDKAEIDVNTFVEGCLRLRGNARSIDVHMLMYQSKWTMKKLSSITASIEEMQGMIFGHDQVLHALTGEDPLAGAGSEVRFAQNPSQSTGGGCGGHDGSSH